MNTALNSHSKQRNIHVLEQCRPFIYYLFTAVPTAKFYKKGKVVQTTEDIQFVRLTDADVQTDVFERDALFNVSALADVRAVLLEVKNLEEEQQTVLAKLKNEKLMLQQKTKFYHVISCLTYENKGPMVDTVLLQPASTAVRTFIEEREGRFCSALIFTYRIHGIALRGGEAEDTFPPPLDIAARDGALRTAGCTLYGR